MSTILESVKKKIGPIEGYDHFNEELIDHINTSFSILHQAGVGPKEGFFIEDGSEDWDSYLTDGVEQKMVRTYVALKARLYFDPPSNGTLMDAMKSQIAELEWRLNVDAETPDNT